MPPLSIQNRLALIFLATVLVRIAFHQLTGFVAHDAYISFRYANNLADGLGFVYNVGEPVLGTSTPLFTFLLALLTLSGMSPVLAASVISTICAGLTAIILYRFACSLRFTRWAFVPVLVYILWPRSLVADTCGMETALFTLLITAAFYCQHRRLTIYALAMATLATVTRPEGVYLLLLLLGVNIYRDRDMWLRQLLVPLALLGPWAMFAFFYFGSPIPNSIPAKLALYSRFGASSPWEHGVYLLAWHNPVGWVLTLAAIAGGYWLYRKQNFGRAAILWLLGMFLFYTFSPTALFFWYVAPLYPIYLLFAAAAFPYLHDRLAQGKVGVLRTKATTATMVVAVVLVAILLVGNYRPVTFYRSFQQRLENVHLQIGSYLLRRSEPDDLVAAEDIGYMGYYSRRRILDRDGLVSPAMLPYNRDGAYRDAVLDFSPDWLVAGLESPISDFLTDSLFLQRYQPDTTIGQPGQAYTVFVRRVSD